MKKSIWALTGAILIIAGGLRAEEGGGVFAAGEGGAQFQAPPTVVGTPIPAPAGLVLALNKPKLFRYSRYVCNNSQKERVSGGPSSCKPDSMWRKYAQEDCGKRGVAKITFEKPCQ